MLKFPIIQNVHWKKEDFKIGKRSFYQIYSDNIFWHKNSTVIHIACLVVIKWYLKQDEIPLFVTEMSSVTVTFQRSIRYHSMPQKQFFDNHSKYIFSRLELTNLPLNYAKTVYCWIQNSSRLNWLSKNSISSTANRYVNVDIFWPRTSVLIPLWKVLWFLC